MKPQDRVRKCGEPSITLSTISKQKLCPSYQHTLGLDGEGREKKKTLPLLVKFKGTESIKVGQSELRVPWKV